MNDCSENKCTDRTYLDAIKVPQMEDEKRVVHLDADLHELVSAEKAVSTRLDTSNSQVNNLSESVSTALSTLNETMKEVKSAVTMVNEQLKMSTQTMKLAVYQTKDSVESIRDKVRDVVPKLEEISTNTGESGAINTSIKAMNDLLTAIDGTISEGDVDIVAAIGALELAFADRLQPKTLTADNVYNTPGTFAFRGNSSDTGIWPVEHCDWAGVQIETGLDAYQIVGSNGYYIRHNDNGHQKTNFAEMTKDDWSDWEKITTTTIGG